MSFLDGLFGSSDDSSQRYLEEALNAYKNIQTPSVQSEEVNSLPEETVQGTVTPGQIQTAEQGPSAFDSISLDPSSRQAMENALQGYQTIADDGGLDANARLGIQQATDAANAQSRGAQGAIMENAKAMGQGGGDFALTQRAIAAHDASNTAATAGLQQAAEAEANREAALSGLANIGSTINSSDYNQAANKAGAQNTINATNTAAKNAANTNNVANDMNSQEFNVGNAQGVNANNTTAKQNQVYYNANLPQQQFNNELAKANGMSGVSSQQANAANQASANNSAMTGKLLGTAGTVAGAALGGPPGALAAKTALAASDGGMVPCYAKGGYASPHDHGICMKMGGHVGGEASVPGDSEVNDTVPAMLSPGELVIPRSIPKNGPAMEAFARNAPVAGDPSKKVDLTSFVSGYKRRG